MKIDIDYHYHIVFVPFRHQNDQTAVAAASTSVEVREVAADRAPVVMEVGNPPSGDSGQRKRYQVKEDGSPRAIRRFEGRLFVEAGPAEALLGAVEADLDKTFFGRVKPRSFKVGDLEGARRLTDGDTVLRRHSSHSKPMRKFEDDKGAKMAAKLAKLAEMMIVVDGTVYEYTPEPIIKIDDRYNAKTAIAPRPSACGGFDSLSFHDYDIWPTTRAALKHAHLVEHLSGAEWPFFRVLDPSASTFDGASSDFTDLVEELFKHLSSSVTGLPWNALEAFYDLRDAREDASGRGTPRLLAAVEAISLLEDSSDVQATAAVAARTAAAGENWTDQRQRDNIFKKRHEFLSSDGMGKASEMAMKALERWRCRPGDAHWENGVAPISTVKASGGRRTFEIMSEGMAVDFALRAGIDPEPVLTAAIAGDRVLACDLSGYFDKYAPLSMALVGADGDVRVIAGSMEDACQLFQNHMEASERSRENDIGAAAPVLTGGF